VTVIPETRAVIPSQATVIPETTAIVPPLERVIAPRTRCVAHAAPRIAPIVAFGDPRNRSPASEERLREPPTALVSGLMALVSEVTGFVDERMALVSEVTGIVDERMALVSEVTGIVDELTGFAGSPRLQRRLSSERERPASLVTV